MGDVPSGLIRRSNQMLIEANACDELRLTVNEAGEDAAYAILELAMGGGELPLLEADVDEIYDTSDDDSDGDEVELTDKEIAELLAAAEADLEKRDEAVQESAPTPGELPII